MTEPRGTEAEEPWDLAASGVRPENRCPGGSSGPGGWQGAAVRMPRPRGCGGLASEPAAEHLWREAHKGAGERDAEQVTLCEITVHAPGYPTSPHTRPPNHHQPPSGFHNFSSSLVASSRAGVRTGVVETVGEGEIQARPHLNTFLAFEALEGHFSPQPVKFSFQQDEDHEHV